MPRLTFLAYDWTLILLVLAINSFSVFVIRSVRPDLFPYQLGFSLIAVLVALLAQGVTRRRLVTWTFPVYALAVTLLAAVLVVGREVNGARAWFDLGPINFQPLELAKIGLVLLLARILDLRPFGRWTDYLFPLMLAAPLLGLVLVQPDFGGTLVLLSILVGMLVVRGMPLGHMLVAAVMAVPLAYFVVWPNLKPYQQERILAGFNPEQYPLDSGFQVMQSKIAIGSGGLVGKGYGQGTQTQLGFVPEQHNDFIFANVGEEWGFVGSVVLLVLYALVFWRLAIMALECNRLSDRLVISGILSMFGFQVMVNIGVTLGLAPVTGLTLPLFSYGGSSLVMVYLALGLALVVHRDRYREI